MIPLLGPFGPFNPLFFLGLPNSVYQFKVNYTCWGYAAVDDVGSLAATCTAKVVDLPFGENPPGAYNSFGSFDLPTCLFGHGEEGFVCNASGLSFSPLLKPSDIAAQGGHEARQRRGFTPTEPPTSVMDRRYNRPTFTGHSTSDGTQD